MKIKNLPKKLTQYNNIHLITHTDLDGIGPSIVLNAFGIPHLTTFVETRKINEAVIEKIAELQDNEIIIITDLSVNDETANLIAAVNAEPNARYIALLDHHASALFLNEFNWAEVVPVQNGIKMSATTLMYKHLLDAGFEVAPIQKTSNDEGEEVIITPDYTLQEKGMILDRVAHFVEDVRLYDTWDWHALSIQEAADLNTIFYARRRYEFAQDRMEYFQSGQLFTAEDQAYLQFSKEELRQILKKKSKQMVIVENFTLKGHDTPVNIGVVETDSYFSELGNHLAEKFENDIDCVFIISLVKNRVSLRSIGSEVNLSEIAQNYNGGGHPNASGCDLSELGLDFISAIFQAQKERK
ncbi:DHH family phosphoesterase [Kurthia sibirica]|uniref:DHH family phosphoesterase n=1 Tax=Kurthia sibirica TaxID=202750 RepID=A0A2U3AJ47_9BACL|nr:DHHA1 domain-containing protein [Kurthia sibirica]PWI24524.1 DHH family phosphoesterase [Kurthia sibirica]GEK33593.1 hypothetical protein KSI01_11260 [Kurthia sibirica]